MNCRALLVVCLLPVSSTAVLAVDPDAMERRATDPETGALPSGWAVGPGMVLESGLYDGGDSSMSAAPTLYFRSEHCKIYLKTAGCRLAGNGWFELDAMADLRLDGFEPGDSAVLVGMEQREDSIDVGFEMEFTTPVGIFEIEALTDALGRHGGQELNVSWNAPLILKRSVIQFQLGYSLKSADLADYYYGVRADEIAPGRPQYDVGSTGTWQVGVRGSQRISRQMLFLYSAQYERFSSAIRSSPIVDDDGQMRLFTGIGWRF